MIILNFFANVSNIDFIIIYYNLKYCHYCYSITNSPEDFLHIRYNHIMNYGYNKVFSMVHYKQVLLYVLLKCVLFIV